MTLDLFSPFDVPEPRRLCPLGIQLKSMQELPYTDDLQLFLLLFSLLKVLYWSEV